MWRAKLYVMCLQGIDGVPELSIHVVAPHGVSVGSIHKSPPACFVYGRKTGMWYLCEALTSEFGVFAAGGAPTQEPLYAALDVL